MFWSKICKWTDVCALLDKARGALEGEGEEERERGRGRRLFSSKDLSQTLQVNQGGSRNLEALRDHQLHRDTQRDRPTENRLNKPTCGVRNDVA